MVAVRIMLLDRILRDLRIAARGLRRSPTFSLVVFGSLTIGLAVAASMIAVINAYLLRTAPYAHVDRLYHVMYAPPGPWEPRGMSALDWRPLADVVQAPIAASSDTFNITEGGPPISASALRVTRGFVEGLGVGVARGRFFDASDLAGTSEPAAVIGDALWRARFGGDAGAIGQTLRIEAESRPGAPETFRVIGVLAPGFYFGRDSRALVDVMVPERSQVRTYMVRLREGVAQPLAERRLTDVVRAAATSPIPADWPGVKLESVRDRYLAGIRPILSGVTVAVALVVAIVAANVAVLMLLRGARREHEIAVRLAIGGTRRDVARLLLMESIWLTVPALIAGLAVTKLALSALAPMIERQLGRAAPAVSGIGVDSTVLVMVGIVAVLTACAASLAPLASWGRALSRALSRSSRAMTDRPAARRMRSTLIVSEVAGSLVLLIGCGLMLRSIASMRATDLGFDSNSLQKSRVMLRARDYPDAAALSRFYRRFAAELSARAGAPVVYSTWPSFALAPTQRIEADNGRAANAGAIAVSDGYFSVFGVRLPQGREFSPADLTAGADVAVISETLARRLWSDGSALGRRIRSVEPTPAGLVTRPWRTVIGIAADVRQAYDDPERADFYTPRIPDGRFGTFYVRSSKPRDELFDLMRSSAAAIDQAAVINEPHAVADDNQQLAGTRFLTTALTGFAVMASLLALIGMYGVTAYAVQQRRAEVAIRVALGAGRRAIVALFLRDGLITLAIGVASGLAAGLLVSRVVGHRIVGVDSFDPIIWVAAAAAIVAAGSGAVLGPAVSASHQAPASVLRGT